MAKIPKLAVWISLIVVFYVLNVYFSHNYFENAFYSFIALAIIHVSLKIILEKQFIRKIKDEKTRYSFRKISSIIYIVSSVIALVLIWKGQAQDVTVALGLVSAGVAFALQDLLKNLAGGLIIYISKIYSVGDRIEINSKTGDVIDIGLFYTSIAETREWISADLPTGRLTTLPNGLVLSNIVNNYTKDHDFIWDEIQVSLDHKSDWKFAYERFSDIINKKTKKIVEEAKQSIEKMGEKYYIENRSIEPTVFVALTDKEILFKIRYPVKVRERGIEKNDLNKLIVEEITNSDKINISTPLLDVVGLPDLNIKNTS